MSSTQIPLRHHVVVVVAKSSASAIFELGQQFVMNFEGAPGTFAVKFWTNYGGKFEIPVPLNFCAEARGPAEGLEDAGRRFANAARAGSTILALVANADLGLLQPELIFDASPDRDLHEFLQIIIPEPPLRAVPNRRIDVEAVSAVGSALSVHPELIRIRRAIAQYALALSLWQPGHEIQCLAHLYMGVEALTKAQLRQHLQANSLSEDALVQHWGIEKKRLDGEVRRRLIFLEDQEAYAKAKAVSDGLEHGFSEYEEMQAPARDVVVATAKHLRRAILDMLSLEERVRDRLLGEDFREPRGPVTLVRYLRGTLSGPAEGLAMADQLYPVMEWRGSIKSVIRGEDGKYSFTTDEACTATGPANGAFGRRLRRDSAGIRPMTSCQGIERAFPQTEKTWARTGGAHWRS
jgi:hypothetical protein